LWVRRGINLDYDSLWNLVVMFGLARESFRDSNTDIRINFPDEDISLEN
jgi:hypothetical protein